MEEYKEIYKIQYYDVDRDHYIKVNRLFEIMTSVATSHSVENNIDAKKLIPKGISWVVYAIHLDIDNSAKLYKQNITVKSFAKDVKGLFILRYFGFYDEDNNLIGKAVSKWVIVDIMKRKIIKIPDYVLDVTRNDTSSTKEQQYIMDNISIQKQSYQKLLRDLSLEVKNMAIRYGDIDENMHVNNSIYPLWAIESLPRDTLKNNKAYRIQITYKKEQIESNEGVKIVCKEQKEVGKINEHVEIHSSSDELLCIVDINLKPM